MEGKPQVVVEDHDDPVFRLQSTEAALELFAVGESGTAVGLCRFGMDNADVGLEPPSMASLVGACIDEQAMQPRIEAVRVADLVQVSPRVGQGGLDSVLGIVGIAQDQASDRVEPIDSGRGKDLECLVVPVPCRLDECSLHRPPLLPAGRDDQPSLPTTRLARREFDLARRRVVGARPGCTPPRANAGVSHRPYNPSPMPATLFPIVLAVHIGLAISLFLPSILLPFTLRTRRATVDSESGVVRTLLWAQSHGTMVIGAGLALSGLALISILGPQMLAQPWLVVALVIYSVNLAIAFFIQRPNLRRLVGIKAASDDAVWKARARRQRYVSYLMAALVGVIGFLMSTKPSF